MWLAQLRVKQENFYFLNQDQDHLFWLSSPRLKISIVSICFMNNNVSFNH